MTVDAEIARSLIDRGRYMSLATTDGVRPWVAAVAYVHSAGPVFYWASRRDARHSEDIRVSGRAAATIFDSRASYEEVEGIQFAGPAHEVPDAEVEPVFALYLKRYPMYADMSPRELASSGRLGLYLLRPEEVWALAPASREGDHRLRVDMSRLS